jgi:hypothetical protein
MLNSFANSTAPGVLGANALANKLFLNVEEYWVTCLKGAPLPPHYKLV